MNFHRLKRTLASALALSSLAFAVPAFAIETLPASGSVTAALAEDAATMDLHYHVWTVGVSMLVRGMGYNDGDGNWVSLAGEQILSARVVLEFTPEPGVDVTMLRMTMAVPVTGAQSQFFEVTGAQLVETTPGTWRYEMSTDMFNGTILEGRFGIESYGLTPDGSAIGMPGVVSEDTGFYFNVTTPVPEPGSALLMLAGVAAVPAFVRRRARAKTA